MDDELEEKWEAIVQDYEWDAYMGEEETPSWVYKVHYITCIYIVAFWIYFLAQIVRFIF